MGSRFPSRVVCNAEEFTNSRTSLGASCDEALAMIQFDKLVSQRNVVPYFQPIVRVGKGTRIGFEVLVVERQLADSLPEL